VFIQTVWDVVLDQYWCWLHFIIIILLLLLHTTLYTFVDLWHFWVAIFFNRHYMDAAKLMKK